VYSTATDDPDGGGYRSPMHERRIGHRLERHRSIGSTNDRARELLAEPDGHGSVVVATALAVADACESVAPVALKWPNDVVSAGDGRKLAGLLVETTVTGERLRGAVLGIGINVNWRRAEMPPELAESATSLADLSGASVDRDALLGRILERIDAEIASVESGVSPLERYRARCSTLGTIVAVETADGLVSGRATDLDGSGALIVEDGDGRRHVVTGGEVTRVRPARVPA
jgi:BirA family transcriptional regulator, biotin operon repressor / biotin---[acetyl-CoA-carboxylase] ligase